MSKVTWNDKIYLSIRIPYKDKHSYLIYKKESISEKSKLNALIAYSNFVT